MKDKLTIVIPSKNEGQKLYECLDSIAHQHRIDGVTVIIADISDDQYSIDIIEDCKFVFADMLDIKVIKGGYPSEGRLAGSKLVKTPYVLFLDADIILLKSNILLNSLNHMKYNNLDLVTVPFSSTQLKLELLQTLSAF
jgi:glycosyltransferase involved in cell wall biosynthesis